MGKRKRARRKTVEPAIAPSASSSRKWILGLILGVSFLSFSNSIANAFAYDDLTQVLRNDFIRDLSNVPKALVTEAWYWRTQQDVDPNQQDKPSTSYYRPVGTLYLMLMWKLFGPSAPGWHFISVLMHLLIVYLAFLILERFTKDTRLSATASLLFAVHPLRSESVAWVSGFTDLLMGAFLLGSFLCYMRYREQQRPKPLVWSLSLFTLAIFAKEPAAALPLFVAAYELFLINRDRAVAVRAKSALKHTAWFLAVAAFYFAARYYTLGFLLSDSNFRSYPAKWIALTIPIVIWKYIALLFWPVKLSIFHATYLVKSPLDMQFVLPLLGLAGLVSVLWRVGKSNVALFGLLWFSAHLLPVLNLSAFTEDFLVQERYVYIPSIGFSLLIAMALVRIPIEKLLPRFNQVKAQTALVTVLVLLLAGKSLAQNEAWKDDLTLWRHGEATAPEQPMSHFILAHKLILAGDYRGAVAQFDEYLKIVPDNPIVLGNMASTLVLVYQDDLASGTLVPDRSNLDRAVELCEKGLSIAPDSPVLWDALGTVHTFETGLKNFDRAIACYQRALGFSPGNAMIKFHLGGTFIKKGNLEEGIPLLKEALADPSIVDAHKFLAYAYRARGQFKEAIEELTIYLRLKPNAPDAQRVSQDVQDLRARLQTATPQS